MALKPQGRHAGHDLPRKAVKAIRLARVPRYRRGLKHGVAAAIEHAAVPLPPDVRTVVDVGAHSGQFALFALERFPRAKLICFEPQDAPRQKLTEVLGPDNERTTIVPSALSSATGSAEMHVSRADDSSSLLPIGRAQVVAFPGTEEAATDLVTVDTLDSVIPSVTSPSLLKIDVQGTELSVLEGATRLLQSITHVLVEASFTELYEGQPLASDVIAFLNDQGFDLTGAFDMKHDIAGHCLQADLLFRRREAASVRVLHVIPSVASRYGGPSRVVRDLATRLSARGHEITVVTTDLDGDERIDPATAAKDFASAEELIVLPTAWPRGYAFAPSMLRVLSEQLDRCDVLNVHGAYQFPTWAACALARRKGVPYVFHPHGMLTRYHRGKKAWKKRPYEAIIERRNLRGAEAIVVMTMLEKETFDEWMPGAPTVIVPPALDPDLEPVDGEPHPPETWGIPEWAETIVFLGRLTPKKGADLLLEAFVRIAPTHPRAHLVIAGPDDDGVGAALVERIADLGLGPRVSVVGMIEGETKHELLSNATMLVLPSEDESFGVSVAEALSVAVPVVITAGVGLARDVEMSGAGLVVDREAGAVAAGIDELLSRPDLRDEMGERAARMAREEFDPDHVASRLESVYRSVAATGRGAGSNGAGAVPDLGRGVRQGSR